MGLSIRGTSQHVHITADNRGRSMLNNDRNKSEINFSIGHLFIHTVRGSFGNFNVIIDHDIEESSQTSIFCDIDVSSIDTKIFERDRVLLSRELFDVENHPKIIFRSKEIIELPENKHDITGELTIKGETRDIVLKAEGPLLGNRNVFMIRGTISRKKWNLRFLDLSSNNTRLVSDEIEIEAKIEMLTTKDILRETDIFIENNFELKKDRVK